jgi:hypothetical protein
MLDGNNEVFLSLGVIFDNFGFSVGFFLNPEILSVLILFQIKLFFFWLMLSKKSMFKMGY